MWGWGWGGGVSLAAETEESYEFGPWAERNSVLSGLSFF